MCDTMSSQEEYDSGNRLHLSHSSTLLKDDTWGLRPLHVRWCRVGDLDDYLRSRAHAMPSLRIEGSCRKLVEQTT